MGEKPPLPAAEPTRVRTTVLALLCALAFVLYIDRIGISQAAPRIEADLHIPHERMGVVFAAFTLAYCLFEVPTGAWGDRYGSRGVLTRIVLWWSLFTALTGAAWGFGSLLVVRFLFGAGEAGALPNTARVLARWFPPARRGPAQGMISAAALVGGAVAPAAAAVLIQALDWRWAFVLFALPGFVWAAGFYVWFRDDPAEHPAVNAAERDLICAGAEAPGGAAHPPIPWRAVLASGNVWILGGVLACSAFNSYLYFSWYPTYLMEGRGVDPMTTGWLASLVLAGGAAGSTIGGAAIDWLIPRTGSRRWSRRALGCGGLGAAAALLLLAVRCDSALASALWTGWSVLAAFLTIASWWGAVADISGRHLGAMFGLMNSLGGLGAIASQLFVGRFVDRMGDAGYEGRARWDPVFFVYAAVLALGALGWLLVDSTRAIQRNGRRSDPCT
jgi:MFS family permease